MGALAAFLESYGAINILDFFLVVVIVLILYNLTIANNIGSAKLLSELKHELIISLICQIFVFAVNAFVDLLVLNPV